MKTATVVYYEGRVQGVGFRATVRWVAGGFEINGRVSNLPDGRVELFAQGEEREVRDFITAVRESELAGHIRKEFAESAAVDPAMRGFQIS